MHLQVLAALCWKVLQLAQELGDSSGAPQIVVHEDTLLVEILHGVVVFEDTLQEPGDQVEGVGGLDAKDCRVTLSRGSSSSSSSNRDVNGSGGSSGCLGSMGGKDNRRSTVLVVLQDQCKIDSEGHRNNTYPTQGKQLLGEKRKEQGLTGVKNQVSVGQVTSFHSIRLKAASDKLLAIIGRPRPQAILHSVIWSSRGSLLARPKNLLVRFRSSPSPSTNDTYSSE